MALCNHCLFCTREPVWRYNRINCRAEGHCTAIKQFVTMHKGVVTTVKDGKEIENCKYFNMRKPANPKMMPEYLAYKRVEKRVRRMQRESEERRAKKTNHSPKPPEKPHLSDARHTGSLYARRLVQAPHTTRAL